MRSHALFIGCNIPVRVPAYSAASRKVLARLGVTLMDCDAFGCCGYPLRNTHQDTWLTAAATNLALAEKEQLDLLTLCKCCFGSFKAAQHVLEQQPERKHTINQHLRKQGLVYQGRVGVKHLLTLLHQDIGLDLLTSRLRTPLKGLNVAAHYGCHALRPSRITNFDNAVAPVVFETLVQAIGATAVRWPKRLECCGAPLLGVNDDMAHKLKTRKTADARASGADLLCTACPWCQIQFETLHADQPLAADAALPSILYPQLLGLAMGMEGGELMLSTQQSDLLNTFSFL